VSDEVVKKLDYELQIEREGRIIKEMGIENESITPWI